MVFSSIPFLFFFLPVFLVLYQIIPADKRYVGWKNGVLLLFSLLFYAWGEPSYILLMLLVTFSDYIVGRCMEGATGWKRRLLLGWSLFFDLSILGFFKYAGFLIGTCNKLFGLTMPEPSIALPLGISFFTFQTLSYVIDLYRGEIQAERSYFTYLTYVSMFPQLVAGPIVRYQTVHKELLERSTTSEAFHTGFQRFLRGLFKKVLLANQIGKLWEATSQGTLGELSVVSIWMGAIAFTFQIYYDFSGYSDMAIGLGKMMGFTFLENFRAPLAAKSITDFWRRWHISLSSWFKSYVYIPLGGNRVGKWKQIRNILVVWMLTGLWHGASWNFVLWGLYYGIWLLLEKLLYGKYLEKAPAWLQHLYAGVIVVVGFVLFALEDFSSLLLYLKAMVGIGSAGLHLQNAGWFLQNYGFVFLLCIFFALPWDEILASPKQSVKCFHKAKRYFSWMYVVLFVVSVACLVSDSYNPFLYFRF